MLYVDRILEKKHSLFFRFHTILNIYAKRLYSARCGHKNLIQHLIPRPKEFNLGLIFQKTIFWCYNARKAHAVCRRQMAAQLKLNSFQNSGFFNNRKFNQLISAGTDVSEQSAICSHTHSLQFTYYAKLTEISEIQQIHNPTQFNWTPTVTIFYCQKLYWVLFQFKWNIKFCWLWRLVSGNCKFLFWKYFNFLARSLTKHNCWHKCVIVCFSNIFP